MKLKSDNLLAVAVCTKRLGLAVFCQKELLFFAVKTLKPPRTVQYAKRQISQIFQDTAAEYAPKLVVLKLLGKHQAKSKKLQSAIRVIKREAQTARIFLDEISFEEAKQKLSDGKKPVKAEAFSKLSKIYPEIKRFVKFQNPSQAEYYNSLFSAVAIGFYFQSKNDKVST
jgi:RNase H-fold protein (predicted Holliday junction resolvase)